MSGVVLSSAFAEQVAADEVALRVKIRLRSLVKRCVYCACIIEPFGQIRGNHRQRPLSFGDFSLKGGSETGTKRKCNDTSYLRRATGVGIGGIWVGACRCPD